MECVFKRLFAMVTNLIEHRYRPSTADFSPYLELDNPICVSKLVGTSLGLLEHEMLLL